jgi:hypothetical protein
MIDRDVSIYFQVGHNKRKLHCKETEEAGLHSTKQATFVLLNEKLKNK